MRSIKDITFGGNGKVVGGDDNSNSVINNYPTKSKLSALFNNLKAQFREGNTTDNISEELNFYITEKDVVGLEKKLTDGHRSYLFDDANELKDFYILRLKKYISLY